MTAYAVACNLAELIQNSVEIQTFAVLNFGQELKVFMDSVGTLDYLDLIDDNFETDEERTTVMNNAVYPHIILSGTSEDGGAVAEGEEFEVSAEIVINASQKNDGTDFDSSKAIRNKNGVYIYADGKKLSQLTNLIKKNLRNFKPGAIFQNVSAVYENGVQYPIQFSSLTINYKTYQAFPQTW